MFYDPPYLAPDKRLRVSSCELRHCLKPIDCPFWVYVERCGAGDLFDGLGENGAIQVARAPTPGTRVTVDARWLSTVARAYGVLWRPASQLDGSVIERASIVIETQRIEAATVEALRQRGMDGRLSLVLDNPATRIHLPTDADPSLQVAGLNHNPDTGRFTVHLVAPAVGQFDRLVGV